ncbi:phospho-N-acetylmuramoyl-pentapeptide-transferase [bacterium]|nr:phospho-N-acetylmuramoyl-pentapeptide-transferase [bacterium]
MLSLAEDAAGASFLRVFDYITVRAGCALSLSFILSILLGPKVIAMLGKMQMRQFIRDSKGENAISLAEMHAHKGGVPTMGGILMIASILISIGLLGDFSQPVLSLALFGMLGYAAIGFADDYLKKVKKNSDGLSARGKIISQVAVGSIFAGVYIWLCSDLVTYNVAGESTKVANALVLPFVKDVVLPIGMLFIPFAILVLTATSNAVNLTDGLDGLAAGVTLSAALCFSVVAYLIGRIDASEYLIIPHVQGAGELAVLLAALCGACLGFLWFNAHPAQVFMGDTGSMMLGGLLGSVALLIKQEALLLIVGGIFVAEALSVILQVGSYKLRKKRIFRMAPLHHHFEKGGVPESKIIARFWIVSALLALAGLVTLKFR